uniref:Uncharacterized protein n=1 Tax=Brassica oleracea var. oleracea TaxID=109376 RepID=A0A0D3AVE6_BRAOL
MTSKKRSSMKKTSPQSSYGNPCTNEEIVPVEEFEVEQEEKEAYWDALCGSITPPPEVFYPTRPATQLDPTLPSRTSPAYLKTLREFYRVPSGVVFRVPVHGESAEDPPEGFFTCYEAFLTRCRMWFPIPEAIVRTLDRFELLIRSYELGMDLSLDDFEGLWSTRKTSIDYSYCMAPKGHTSNAKGWFENFFYVRIDGASVEENCLPLFRGKWNFHRGTTIGNLGMRVFNSTLDGSFREARLSHFKAEEIERKFIRFQNEVAERERRQAQSHSQALIRAERKGRRTISAELARRATLFDAEFRSFMDAQDYVGDFRECRSSVGTLWKSQNADFSFLSEVVEMSGLIDGCTQAESMVPPIEGRIRELWEPIEVLEDTMEAGADAANEGGEVDQPADSFGASISGYLDLDL